MNTPNFQSLAALLGAAIVLCLSAPRLPAQAAAPAGPSPDGDQTVQLTPFEVSESANGYMGAETTTGTRYAAPISEIPFNVQIVTDQQIEDFQAFDLAGQSAFAYTGSFSNAFPESSTGVITVRGIRGFAVFKNGIREGGVYGPASIDRIELIEGESDSVYGQAEPSGAINRVTKEGQPNPFEVLNVIYGDDSYSRTMIDVNQPIIAKDDKLLFRFAASYENSDQFPQEYAHFWRQNLYGSFTYRFTPSLVFTVHSEYIKLDSTSQSASTMPFVYEPVVLNGVSTTQLVGHFGEGPWNSHLFNTINTAGPFSYNKVGYEQTDANLIESYRHWLTVMLLGNYWWRPQENPQAKYAGTNSDEYDAATGVLQGMQSLEIQANHQYQANGQANILADFRVGPIHDKLLITADYVKQNEPWNFAAKSTLASASIPLQNYINEGPDASAGFPYAIDFGDTAVWNSIQTHQSSDTITKGAQFSERLGFFDDRLIAIAGVRHDQIDQSLINDLASSTITATHQVIPAGQLVDYPDQDAYTTQDGLVFKITPQISMFADFATDFVPQSANVPVLITGDPVPPTSGQGGDFGFKADLFEHKLSFTTDVFDALRRNIAAAATGVNGQALDIPGTTQTYDVAYASRTYGWEIDGTWNPLPNLSIFGGLGWDHIRYADVENPTQYYLLDVTPDGTPAWAGGIAGLYYFTGALKGFFLRVGVNGQSWQITNQGTSGNYSIFGNSNVKGPVLVENGVSFQEYYFKDAGWVAVNPGFGFMWHRGSLYHKLSLNLSNALNRRYFVTSPSGPQIMEGIAGNVSYTLSFGKPMY